MYEIYFSKRADKDKKLLKQSHLDAKVKNLLKLIANNPFQNPPPYEKLIGDLNGAYSRRINVQHRLIYTVDNDSKIIKVVSMWTHYE